MLLLAQVKINSHIYAKLTFTLTLLLEVGSKCLGTLRVLCASNYVQCWTSAEFKLLSLSSCTKAINGNEKNNEAELAK